MKLFEVELVKPLLLSGGPKLEYILPNIGRYRFREWEVGQPQEDITSSSWLRPSHSWLLSRRSDGVGILRILPVLRNAVISVTERRAGHERREELGEVTYLLDRPRKIHLLVGGSNAQREERHATSLIRRMGVQASEEMRLYKIVCTAADNVQIPFE